MIYTTVWFQLKLPEVDTALPTSTVGSGFEARKAVLAELIQTRTLALDCFLEVTVILLVSSTVVRMS